MSLVIFLCPTKKELDFDVVALMEVFLEEYREKRMRVPSFSRDFFEEARKSKTKVRFVFGPECMESGVDFLEDLC